MNHPSSILDLLLSCCRFKDSIMFLRENREVVTYGAFVDHVLSIGCSMLSIPESFLVITASDPVLYAEGYIASIISGHVGCLEKPGNSLSEGYQKLQNKRILADDELLNALQQGNPDLSKLPTPCIDRLCTVAMSSGTASKTQKLTGISQKALICDTVFSMKHYRYQKDWRCVHLLPYWHMFGIIAELLAPLFSGATVCIPESNLSFFTSLKRFKPDFLQLPPAVASQMLMFIQESGIEQATGGNLKKILISGAPIEDRVCHGLTSYGIDVCTAYGLTECSPCVSIMPDWDIREGTSGRVIDCLEVRIASDNEILVNGPTLMLGYLSDDGSLHSPIVDGWLHTGDLGNINPDGYLTVTGRKSSIIVLSNGNKYVPEQIEKRINEIPHITESLVGMSIDSTDQVLSLIIVFDEQTPDRKLIDVIMQEFGVSTYQCKFQHKRLARNAMGKLIR